MKLNLASGHNAINPDTGWIDPGTCFGNYQEAKIAESIKILIAKNLDNRIPYHIPKYFWDTEQQYEEGLTHGCDYMLILHCNSYNQKASGALAFYNDNPRAGNFADTILTRYTKSMGLAYLSCTEKEAVMAMTRKEIPIVLLELAFLDNKNDRNILVNQQQYLADSITDSLLFVAGIKETIFQTGSNIVEDNFKKVILSAPVKEIGGRTFVPLRDFAIMNGKKIGYMPNTKKVFLY